MTYHFRGYIARLVDIQRNSKKNTNKKISKIYKPKLQNSGVSSSKRKKMLL